MGVSQIWRVRRAKNIDRWEPAIVANISQSTREGSRKKPTNKWWTIGAVLYLTVVYILVRIIFG